MQPLQDWFNVQVWSITLWITTRFQSSQHQPGLWADSVVIMNFKDLYTRRTQKQLDIFERLDMLFVSKQTAPLAFR